MAAVQTHHGARETEFPALRVGPSIVMSVAMNSDRILANA
jgi:hypothetical protein